MSKLTFKDACCGRDSKLKSTRSGTRAITDVIVMKFSSKFKHFCQIILALLPPEHFSKMFFCKITSDFRLIMSPQVPTVARCEHLRLFDQKVMPEFLAHSTTG